MKNLNKLFEKNSKRTVSVKLTASAVIFRDRSGVFSGETIDKIIAFVNSVHKKYKGIKVPIVFQFGEVLITDKLSYVIFECICYYLINTYHHRVYVFWKPEDDILTQGVFSSPLLLLNSMDNEKAKMYPSRFMMDIYGNHFRRLIRGENSSDNNYLGNLFKELDSFLKVFDIVEEYRDQVSEVIAELVGNACEHGDSDCLLDIDITSDHIKEEREIRQEGQFYGINIAVLNFSDNLLGDGIKNKLNTNRIDTDRYDLVKRALYYHKKFFCKNYTEEDFYNITALQDKISGRLEYEESGGTGLTKLIKTLQDKADTDTCYMISGRRSVFFIRKLIEYDRDNWLGFNKDRNYLTDIPDEQIVTNCLIYFPGTAYNLNFVMKREEKNE
ncbi:MAG: hypothetical protein J6B50_10320 [Lachnospiraceae bacterium]|nr:hypothetical protein [Lachnospiraceae bacterium]